MIAYSRLRRKRKLPIRVTGRASLDIVAEIPVAQAGPFGLAFFRTEAITRGLGIEDVATGKDARPKTETQIRYDAQDIVREIRE